MELELRKSFTLLGIRLDASGESLKKNGINKKKSRDEERRSPKDIVCAHESKRTEATLWLGFLILSPQMLPEASTS